MVRHEEISINRACLGHFGSLENQWRPQLNRFSCVPSVTVVVGGWGRDDDGPGLEYRQEPVPSDANREVLSPKVSC